MEASLLPSPEIRALAQKAVLAASRNSDPVSEELLREFHIPYCNSWIVVLDGKGETLASFLCDSWMLGCNVASKNQFPAKLTETIEKKGLAEKESVQALVRRWLSNRSDPALLDRLSERYEEMIALRKFADFCEWEAAAANCPVPSRDLLRIHSALARLKDCHRDSDAEPEKAYAEAARVVAALPSNSKTEALATQIFDAQTRMIWFDVPARLARQVERIRALKTSSPDPQAVERHCLAIEEKARKWKEETTAQLKGAANVENMWYEAAMLGDAQKTIDSLSKVAYKDQQPYKQILADARAKLGLKEASASKP